MCIIVIKPEGIAVPDISIFKTCAKNNPDGIGYMERTPEDVTIRKGFSDVKEFYKDISGKTDREIVVHFRYATHGTKSAGNCHPFPLTNDIDDLKNEWIGCDIGIAHNGIISTVPKHADLSDTMMFIKSISAESIKAIPGLMERVNGGKFTVMTRYKTYIIGDFIYDNKTGCYFSNTSYEKENYYEVKSYNYMAGVPGVSTLAHCLCDDCRFNHEDKYGLNGFICDRCDGVQKYVPDKDEDRDIWADEKEEWVDYWTPLEEEDGIGSMPCPEPDYGNAKLPEWWT